MNKIKTAVLLLGVIITLGAFTVPSDKYFEIMKNIEIFSNVYKELNTHYVDEVNPSQLMRTGIDAMTLSLDPYTNYISESQVEGYRISDDRKYNGMGASSELIDGKITITEVFEGGGAQKSGLAVGDQILAIDGKSTIGRTNEEVLRVLRGAAGSTVNMSIQKPNAKAPIKMAIERSAINIPNVPYSGIVGDHIGYIALTTFTPDAGKNVAKALKKLKREQENLGGVILDLRFNGGGLLREAINVSNVFVPNAKTIVSTKGKVKDRDQNYKTKNEPIDTEIPLVVLINKRSASASEIVSGVIQDFDRGVIMGKRSYGKGLVQNTMEVGYNSRLKLTTSKYYIPSGRCIQSVAYEDGEPIDVPDDQRAQFKTINGRTVLDGGGISPDIVSHEAKTPGILKNINEQHLIMKFLNGYVNKIDSIANPRTYQFTDYKLFTDFLKSNGFEYNGGAQDQIKGLIDYVDHESLSETLKASINSIQSTIQSECKDDLIQYQDEITREIETKIVSRFNFQKGKLQKSLNTDPQIKDAIDVLNDSVRYNKTLGK